MHAFWEIASTLGSSKLLVPAAIVTVVAGRMQAAGKAWLIGIAVISAIVVASKIAFLGWGIGLLAVDFTGFSGHAAIAAAVYPVLLAALSRRHWRSGRAMSASVGILVAVIVCISRVELKAHSISEVLTGGLLGVGVSAFVLIRWREKLTVNITVVTLAFALSWAVVTIWLSDVRTESLIIHTALSLSHRDVPYHRHHLPLSKRAGKVHDL